MVKSLSAARAQRQDVRVGVIGLGVRGMDAIARNMAETYPAERLRVDALCDQNVDRAHEASQTVEAHYRAVGCHISPRIYGAAHDLIADDELDLIVITTPTYTHREIATEALASGKKVYCDKPLAQNVAESQAILDAEEAFRNPLLIGFTRRFEAPWIEAAEVVARGEIGDLRMIHSRTIIPYHRYLTGWWRRREWSGGALNDKGSHIFDVFNWLSGSFPVAVSAVGGRSMIEPDMEAPVRCSRCDRECVFRRREMGTGHAVAPDLKLVADSVRSKETDPAHIDDWCVYRSDSDIYHNGTVRFTYESGVLATYLFSFFGPPSPDEETLELVGTTGRVMLTRALGRIDIATLDGSRNRTFSIRNDDFDGSHFGADKELIRALGRLCDGDAPAVSAAAGHESVLMVAAALESMDKNGKQIEMETTTHGTN